MRCSFYCSLAALALLPVMAVAQDSGVPKAELAMGYSYLNVHPTKALVTSFNMNGGGIGFVYNINRDLGIKADFMGYNGNNTVSSGSNSVRVDANLFTYLFGPQFTKRGHRVNYFGEALFGAGHTNGDWNQFYHISLNPGSVGSSNNSFMMEFGGGLDFRVGRHIAIRPVEADYLFARYSTTNISSQQNAFKYFAGINVLMGSH